MTITDQRHPPLIRPKNDLETHKFNLKREYPIHRNNLYWMERVGHSVVSR